MVDRAVAQFASNRQGRIVAADMINVSEGGGNQENFQVSASHLVPGAIMGRTSQPERMLPAARQVQANGRSGELGFLMWPVNRGSFADKRFKSEQQISTWEPPKRAIDPSKSKKPLRTPLMESSSEEEDEEGGVENAPRTKEATTAGDEDQEMESASPNEEMVPVTTGVLPREESMAEMIRREVQAAVAKALADNTTPAPAPALAPAPVYRAPTFATVTAAPAPLPVSAPLRSMHGPKPPPCGNCGSQREVGGSHQG